MGPKTHGWDPKNYWMGPKRFFAKNMAARKLFYKKHSGRVCALPYPLS